MDFYKSVADDLADYITAYTPDGDAKMTNPIPYSNVFIGEKVAFKSDFKGDYQVVVKLSTGTINPKWARDRWFVVFQVVGKDRSAYLKCQTLIQQIADDLNGKSSFKIRDKVYVHPQINVAPTFIRSTELSEPLFTFTLDVHTDYIEDNGNRKAIPCG